MNKTTLVVGTNSLMCLDSLQPTFNWKNVSNAIPWYLKTSGMTTVIIIINNETQIIWVSVSCWWNKVLSQWYRSSASDVPLKKLFSWNAANPPELPHSCVISTKFYNNFTEIHLSMGAPPENCYIFTKLLPIRKISWKTTSYDKTKSQVNS